MHRHTQGPYCPLRRLLWYICLCTTRRNHTLLSERWVRTCMHACKCVYMCMYVVQACWHIDTSYIYTYIYICMNIGTHSEIHKCINTYIHTCTHIHIAVLTASCESQHQCGAVSGLVMSLSPSARITYSLAGTIKFEMPISEVSSVYIYTHRYAYTYTSTQKCIDTHIEMDINMHASDPKLVPFQSEECAL